MASGGDLRERLRQEAVDALGRVSAAEREALLVKCWLSHDARWFTAVAVEYGMDAANRVNKVAAHELGKVEAPRVARAVGRPPIASIDDYLAMQEILIGILGPDLLDYSITKAGDDGYELRVQRCFAHDQVQRAGIAADYECGIVARVTGWFEGLGLDYEVSPCPGRCFKALGRECAYTIRVKGRRAAGPTESGRVRRS